LIVTVTATSNTNNNSGILAYPQKIHTLGPFYCIAYGRPVKCSWTYKLFPKPNATLGQKFNSATTVDFQKVCTELGCCLNRSIKQASNNAIYLYQSIDYQ